ncbi:hypothetical protein T440DRAFT_527985 [Plenodomus tracheiphilus IPT5]|uniref:Protein kinase domain-containing protein n=1 Tax=Plenodomus tracheiphilus IPT5 TaxID=1408161 RepID=A0A6A7BB46_9PLEO|nr:hypothetical protein T440DRAFT_527985 [Plenodomus tracheiphilus IPT5]
MDRLMLLQDAPLSLVKWNEVKKERLFSAMCSSHYTHVSHNSTANKGMKNEIALLKVIRDQSDSHYAQDRFFQLLNWDTSRLTPQWFTTSTFPIGCTLEELQYHYPSMPEDFTWLVFTQLLEALDFLHNVCDPPIAHGDLFPGNIMIGYPNSESKAIGGLPQVKLIDFEGSQFSKRDHTLASDNVTLTDHAYQGFASDILQCISILYIITALHPSISDYKPPVINNSCEFPDIEADSAKLHLLSETLKASQQRAYGNTPWVLQSLYNYFAPRAYEKLANISESAEAQMRDVILDVSRPKFVETQRRLVELFDTLV